MSKKVSEVKEFDYIVCNQKYESEYECVPENTFQDLKRFICSFKGSDDYADALDFFSIGYRRDIGETISVKNYVGLIQMQNGYQVQILPKISFGDEEDQGNKRTKQILMNMLRSMKDFPCKVFNETNLRIDRMDLYEVFINMFIQEVEHLVKNGLKSSYAIQEDNIKCYKGKLLVNEHIKNNVVHKEQFYVSFDEYNVNRAENRLIKATLLKLQQLSDNYENQKDLRQLLTYFETVDASINYEQDFSKVVIDRNTQDYEALMRWARVFLLNKSFTSFSGSTNARALLFPMERVFESYVAQELRKSLIGSGWRMNAQDKGHYLFDAPRRFALIPDIVMKRDDGKVIVLDTKWKRLINNPNQNYGISQPDMYQMYVYAKKYNTSDIWLLYPVNDQMKNDTTISFTSNDNVKVSVFFVDLAIIKESMKLLCEKIAC